MEQKIKDIQKELKNLEDGIIRIRDILNTLQTEKSTKILKHNYSGKSLLQLKKKFGTGGEGFWNNEWWFDEKFAKEKPSKGVYEIDFEKNLTNLTYEEQKSKIKKGWKFPHPAVLVEAILTHYEKTGERLLEDWYSRTSCVVSDGFRVYVGYFASDGLFVYYYSDGDRYSSLGVSASRKS